MTKRRREEPTAFTERDIVHDDVRNSAERAAEDAVLRVAMQQLPSKCRILLEALYLRPDEPAYATLSAELGVPIGSIGPSRGRCLERLRQILESLDADITSAGGLS